jgi:hypothetical protein
MTVATARFLDPADLLVVRRRRWVDLLLVAGGAWLIVAGIPAAGAPLAALGLVLPVVHRLGTRGGARASSHLVPPELVQCHAALVAAATLPGVVDGPRVVESADDLMLEVAALLGGRPPRGAAQRRFVDARMRVLCDATADLRERHEAWVEATAEVQAMAPATEAPAGTAERRPGVLAGLLVVLLLPVFLTWDLVRGIGLGVVALFDGLALRLRSTGTLLVRGARRCGRTIALAGARWTAIRTGVAASACEAHARVVAARLRLRLHLRRARRIGARG